MNRTSMASLLASLPPHAKKLNAATIRRISDKTKADAERFDRMLSDRAAPKNERELQNQIEALLRQRGIVPIRQRMDKRSNLEIGIPDILFATRGRPIAWEIKLPGQNPRPEQEAVHVRMRPDGWIVEVIRSYAESLNSLNSIQISPEDPSAVADAATPRPVVNTSKGGRIDFLQN